MNALQMFRRNYDYIEIANLTGSTEAEVEKEIHRLRKIEREGCAPAEIYVKPQYSKISYAGKERMTPPEWGL